MFYYEPRGDEVVWKDRASHGFGCGAWCAFLDQVAPLTEGYEVNLGSSVAEGQHALILDRVLRQAYFADRHSAERLVARQPLDWMLD